MDKNEHHRLNDDPDILSSFSRTLPEIEWLLLVLILFYLVVGDIEATDKSMVILASCLYTGLVIIFQYINFFNQAREWKISIQTWAMIFFISYVIWNTGRFDSPLFNLYLLPIIASAITLGKLNTLLETGLIGASIIYLQNAAPDSDKLFSLAGGSELLMQFSPLLLVAYITTMLSADIQKGFNRLKISAETDELTQLFNRRTLDHLSLKMFGMAKRHNRSLSMLMLDVDNLKPVNDQFGHEAGNLLLTNIAQCLISVLREEDIVARYGGDEFVMLLPDCTPEKALIVAHRIIEEFKVTHLRYQGSSISLSASIGIAGFPNHGQSDDEILHKADLAMYTSKQQGNNRVSIYKQEL